MHLERQLEAEPRIREIGLQLLRDNLLLSAQAGRNEFNRTKYGENPDCPYANDLRGEEEELVGCWAFWNVTDDQDTRNAYRLDVDWQVGEHSLRTVVVDAAGEEAAASEPLAVTIRPVATPDQVLAARELLDEVYVDAHGNTLGELGPGELASWVRSASTIPLRIAASSSTTSMVRFAMIAYPRRGRCQGRALLLCNTAFPPDGV